MSARAGPAPIAGIVGYSGMLAGPERLADEARAASRRSSSSMARPIPWFRCMALHAAVPVLGAAGFAVEWHVSPGLEHGIDGTGLQLGAEFLRRVLT